VYKTYYFSLSDFMADNAVLRMAVVLTTALFDIWLKSDVVAREKDMERNDAFSLPNPKKETGRKAMIVPALGTTVRSVLEPDLQIVRASEQFLSQNDSFSVTLQRTRDKNSAQYSEFRLL
jgi:hypothetical protein